MIADGERLSRHSIYKRKAIWNSFVLISKYIFSKTTSFLTLLMMHTIKVNFTVSNSLDFYLFFDASSTDIIVQLILLFSCMLHVVRVQCQQGHRNQWP